MRFSLARAPLALTLLALTAPLALAAPPALTLSGVVAPHPKHCMAEGQWEDPVRHSPFNLFDPSALWEPCALALKDQGYSIRFLLKSPVKVDGFKISQVYTTPASKGSPERARRAVKRMQVLFFNSAISTRYPIYFHDVHFDELPEVVVRYSGELDWNPILLRDAGFDERRRALNLPPYGFALPMEIDAVGVVFWDLAEGEAPTALKQLTLLSGGRPVAVKGLKDATQTQAELLASIYPKVFEGFLLIGQERSLVFASTGTLWGMEGEEEEPKVMGAWRFTRSRMEVSFGADLKDPKRRARAKFEPLSSLIDETPARLSITHPRIGGDYEVSAMRLKAPKDLLGAELSLSPNGEVGEPVPMDAPPKAPKEELPPSFERE